MTTAIIGAGNIASAVARHLTAGGERVVLAAGDEADAAALAGTLGGLASAAPLKEAIQARCRHPGHNRARRQAGDARDG